MFEKWFGKKEKAPENNAPEIMGLRMGGAFEINDLKLRLLEPELVVEGVARTQLIQAMGVVQMDENSTLLRYYTDDEGFLQVLLTGGMTENHISDVKLWYFYEVKGIGTEQEWNRVLTEKISRVSASLEGFTYNRIWESTGTISPPVAMTEKTYAQNGTVSETDQFIMLYERQTGSGESEYMMYSGEEKVINDQLDRCLVISTGFDIKPADIEIIG